MRQRASALVSGAILLAGACTDDPTSAASPPSTPEAEATADTTAAPVTTPASGIGRVIVCPHDRPATYGTLDYAADATGEPTVAEAVARHLALGINDWYPQLTVHEITPIEGGVLVTLRDDNGAVSAALWVGDLGEGRGYLVSQTEVCSPTPEPDSG